METNLKHEEIDFDLFLGKINAEKKMSLFNVSMLLTLLSLILPIKDSRRNLWRKWQHAFV